MSVKRQDFLKSGGFDFHSSSVERIWLMGVQIIIRSLDSSASLITIDPVAGTCEKIGFLGPETDDTKFVLINGLAFDDTGVLFGVDSVFGGTVPDTSLIVIDPTAASEAMAARVNASNILGGTVFGLAFGSVGVAGPQMVDIDIKPGSFPNSINLGSGGATPVAILGSATLDVNDIDITTLTLGTAGIKTVGKTDRILCSVNDVSGDFSGGLEGAPDSFDDLVCHFITVDIVPEAGDTEATISGNLTAGAGGTPIEGTDSVNIVPK